MSGGADGEATGVTPTEVTFVRAPTVRNAVLFAVVGAVLVVLGLSFGWTDGWDLAPGLVGAVTGVALVIALSGTPLTRGLAAGPQLVLPEEVRRRPGPMPRPRSVVLTVLIVGLLLWWTRDAVLVGLSGILGAAAGFDEVRRIRRWERTTGAELVMVRLPYRERWRRPIRRPRLLGVRAPDYGAGAAATRSGPTDAEPTTTRSGVTNG